VKPYRSLFCLNVRARRQTPSLAHLAWTSCSSSLLNTSCRCNCSATLSSCDLGEGPSRCSESKHQLHLTSLNGARTSVFGRSSTLQTVVQRLQRKGFARFTEFEVADCHDLQHKFKSCAPNCTAPDSVHEAINGFIAAT
jgi:hypothetical protein